MNYPYIRAWGMMLGSFSSYIDYEVRKAEWTHAPQTAFYLHQDGSWETFEGIQLSDTRERIISLVETMKKPSTNEMQPQKYEDKNVPGLKKVHIRYLDYYTRQMSKLTNKLSDMQEKFVTTVDCGQAEQLNSQLKHLLDVINSIPLARRGVPDLSGIQGERRLV